ncbi:MAG: hypothetical protein LC798_19680 [Chloroflexi bacterium]|nr:hypothetical protein [Chloroflexota bacterium]
MATEVGRRRTPPARILYVADKLRTVSWTPEMREVLAGILEDAVDELLHGYDGPREA